MEHLHGAILHIQGKRQNITAHPPLHLCGSRGLWTGQTGSTELVTEPCICSAWAPASLVGLTFNWESRKSHSNTADRYQAIDSKCPAMNATYVTGSPEDGGIATWTVVPDNAAIVRNS